MVKIFVDIQEMPDYNPVVKDNVRSMRDRQIFIDGYPNCMRHGAMNKVSKDGIWRCLICGVGCYELEVDRRVNNNDR